MYHQLCREKEHWSWEDDNWLTAAENVEVSKLLLLPSHARQNKNIQEEIHLCVFSSNKLYHITLTQAELKCRHLISMI